MMFKLPLTQAQYDVLISFERSTPSEVVREYFLTSPDLVSPSVIRNSVRTCSRLEIAFKRTYQALLFLSSIRESGAVDEHFRISDDEFMSVSLFETIEPLLPRYLNNPTHVAVKVLLSTGESATKVAMQYGVDRPNLLRKKREVLALIRKVDGQVENFNRAFL
ncbi:hypothetical protein [Vibrio alginolyticus]|uniref:hypothetical protein n=1 Tax=Vibrio alginolyticus TaxID=663 RepID=UPI0015F3D397|nr:hypothetical protein [Vibrio alginolyticus]